MEEEYMLDNEEDLEDDEDDCYDNHWPSDEENDLCNKFFKENGKYLYDFSNLEEENKDNVEYGDHHDRFYCDDYKLANKILKENSNLFPYTIVDGDDGYSAWLIEGWHYCNREGYILSTKKLELPEGSLRYW